VVFVVLLATVKVTVPLPVPAFPELMVIHEALLVAVQPHPAGATTAIDAVKPLPVAVGAPSFSP
jgi:hypothetical protein